jgi:hypothetical protein
MRFRASWNERRRSDTMVKARVLSFSVRMKRSTTAMLPRWPTAPKR